MLVRVSTSRASDKTARGFTLKAQSTVARSITFEAIVKEHELFLARQKTSRLRLVAFAWERFPGVFSYLSDSVGGTDLASPEALT